MYMTNICHLRNGSMTQDVIRRGGLLDPQRFDLSQSGHPADGLGYVPSLVGIDHLTQSRVEVNKIPNCKLKGEQQPYQCVTGSNHLPDEATPPNVVL